MRLWLRYFKEKRLILILYALTVFFFILVGSLYHMENLEKLLYAALLTFTVWSLALLGEGLQYVRKSRQLEKTFHHFEFSGELLLPDSEVRFWQKAEGGIEAAESLHEAQLVFLSLVCQAHRKEQRLWEAKASERSDYYMMWTHQIKTPISAIRLLLDKSGLRDRDVFLLKEELFQIEQYAEMVLTFQRLESISTDLVLESHDLYGLLKQAVKKYALSFINKSLSLELPEPTEEEGSWQVLTDEKWFVFCLEQLLSNSIKYTNKGGISIRTWGQGERVLLSIEDTGIGIRAEDLPRIFEKGFTGYNGRLDKKSTGIGLYLCRQIFTHLNVTIQAQSEEGQGTKIILGIPSGNLNGIPFAEKASLP